MPKAGLIHRDRESSVIRPLLYLQATMAGLDKISDCFIQSYRAPIIGRISDPSGSLLTITFHKMTKNCKQTIVT